MATDERKHTDRCFMQSDHHDCAIKEVTRLRKKLNDKDEQIKAILTSLQEFDKAYRELARNVSK